MNVYYSFVASLGEFIISSSWIICFLPFWGRASVCTVSDIKLFSTWCLLSPVNFSVCTGSGQIENIILLEMALNAVDLPQLPLLLLLNYTYSRVVRGLLLLLLLFVIVCRMTNFIAAV